MNLNKFYKLELVQYCIKNKVCIEEAIFLAKKGEKE